MLKASWFGRLFVMVSLVLLAITPASAQNVANPYQLRLNQLIFILNGGENYTEFFAPSFLTAVPPEQLRTISADVTRLYGRAIGARPISMDGAYSGKIEILFELGIGEAEMVLEPDAPHRIIGLLITGFRQRDDSFAGVSAEIAALPGRAGFAVAELIPNNFRPIAGVRTRERFAIGSTFKLYILAELAAQVQSGQRAWADTVPLTTRSLPSGILQEWPANAPVTLHSLAALMISVSDNTATDVLLYSLGRGPVERRVVASGHRTPADMVPFLGTREAFSMKMPAASGFREQFIAHGDVGQARLLNANQAMLHSTPIDAGLLANAPVHIDTIEWFASPDDLIRLMEHIQRMGSAEMMEIMAINKGIGAGDAGRWRYLGYKGGSETGVLNLTFLGQRHDGRWFVVTGSWNNPDAALDEAAFVVLMTRVLNLAVVF